MVGFWKKAASARRVAGGIAGKFRRLSGDYCSGAAVKRIALSAEELCL
jgi:hypothetical protein